MSNEELVFKIQSGQDREWCLTELYRQNTGVLLTVVKRFQKYENLEDLMQEGYIGLMKAADRWEPERGATFSGYAAMMIKGAVLGYLRNNGSIIRFPVYYRGRILQYKRVVAAFQREHGRRPSPDELGAALGLSAADAEQIRADARLLSIRSLQEPTGGAGAGVGADLTLEGTIADPEDVLEGVLDEIQREELSSLLWDLVDELGDRKSAVIRSRFQHGKTLKSCGEDLGISIETVRRIEVRALKDLRKKKNTDRIRSFIDDEKAYSLGLHGTGLRTFKDRGMSATETAAFKLMGIKFD